MNENEFLGKAKAALDEHENELDADILARLNTARYNALHLQKVHPEKMQAEPRGRLWFAWGGVGSIATASLVAAFWLLNPDSPNDSSLSDYVYGPVNASVDAPVSASEGLLIEDAISDEDIAMLDNIEFVAWLMEQEDSNAG